MKSRRNALKTLGLAAGSIVAGPLLGYDELGQKIHKPEFSQTKLKFDKPITSITLGAGARGNVYGNYAIEYPSQLDIVGVAEPITFRNDKYAKLHNIDSHNRFETWEHVFDRPKFADAIIISTPDDLHYGPCMEALKLGYDILLEKPIAPTEIECRNILALAKKTGSIVAVCHVLRYAPYFIELKDIVESGKIGELISVQHFEPIGNIHMSHSYVRGNWHNSKETTPIILAKSCHDLDILRWIIGSECSAISAFGDLKWFRKENKPEGATSRCMDGCAIEKDCPYSAMKIYYRERSWNYVFDLPEDKDLQAEVVLDYMKNSNYGRCVYDMENDQADHYVVNMQFKSGVTAAFSMEAFTSYSGRRTRIMGSHGDIVGDMSKFTYTDFRTNKKTEWAMATDGHGGGDWNLVKDWLQAVSSKDSKLLSSTIDASIESHVMGFSAEKSRLEGKTQQVKL